MTNETERRQPKTHYVIDRKNPSDEWVVDMDGDCTFDDAVRSYLRVRDDYRNVGVRLWCEGILVGGHEVSS